MTLRFTTSRAVGAAVALTLGSVASAAAQTTTGAAGTSDSTMDTMQDSTRRSAPSSARRARNGGMSVRKDATMGGMSVQKEVAPAPEPEPEPAPVPAPAPEPVPAPLPPAPEPVPAPAPAPEPVVTTTTTVTEQPGARFGNGAYFGIGAGANFPQNNINDFYRPGVNANAVLGWDPQTSPIGLRLNVAYNRLQGETIAAAGTGATVTNISYRSADLFSGFLDAKLRLPFGRLFGATSGLYAVAGPGVTYFRNYQSFQNVTGVPVTTPDNALYRNATRFAVNGGAGLDFGIGPASLFLEGRYVRTFTQGRDTDYVPVTLGLRFQTR